MKLFTIYLTSDDGLVTFNTLSDNVENAIKTTCRTLLAPESAVVRTTFKTF